MTSTSESSLEKLLRLLGEVEDGSRRRFLESLCLALDSEESLSSTITSSSGHFRVELFGLGLKTPLDFKHRQEGLAHS